MSKVDANRLQGNAATGRVAALLEHSSCTVRRVTGDTDVGVDLYCETVEGGKPFLHFWVQVKSGSSCRHLADDSASYSFDKPHLEYWRRQPVPVFGALVLRPDDQSSSVYVVNLTDQLLGLDLDRVRKRRSLRSDLTLDSQGAVDQFVHEAVPRSTALMACQKGTLASLPYVEPEYFREMPTAPVERYQQQILTQVRSTAAWSVMFLERKCLLHRDEFKPFRDRMTAVVEQFEGDRHWENFASRAYCLHIDGDLEGAVRMYEEAIADIENDSRCHGRREWELQVLLLEQRRDKAKAGGSFPV